MHLIFFLLLRAFDIFNPSPPIVVARDTTYITAPLGRDGLPDYEKYWLQTARNGVTPENNAGVLLWQAVWPNLLDPPDYEPMRAELGLKRLPLEKAALQRLRGRALQRRVSDWLKTQRLRPEDLAVDEITEPAIDHRWTAQQFPPLADWVQENERPLDLLVRATHRPRLYSPSPTLLNSKRDMLIEMLLPGAQNAREAACALGTRAMFRVGENRLNDAWSDLLAIHRLARLQGQSPTLVEQFVAAAISEIACRETLTLLSSDDLTVELARQISHDLAKLSDVTDVAASLDHAERLTVLDAIIHMKLDGMAAASGDQHPFDNLILRVVPIDWNIVLKHANHWYDRLVEVAKMQNRNGQKRECAKIDANLTAEAASVKDPANIRASAFSRTRRSELIGSIACTLLLPATDAAITAELRTRTKGQLTRLAAALAVFRAERRAYPAKLSELVPELTNRLPVDLYTSQPFVYKRTHDGYVLYSVGDNGTDDQGDNATLELIAGNPLEDLKNSGKPQPEIPAGADDIAICVPRAPFQFPKAAAPTK